MHIKVFKLQTQAPLTADIKYCDERQLLIESSGIQPQCCSSDSTAVLCHAGPLPAVYITACFTQLFTHRHPCEILSVVVIKVSMNNPIWGVIYKFGFAHGIVMQVI